MSKKFYTWFACCLLALLTALPLSVNAAKALPYSYGFEDNDLTTDGWTKSSAVSTNDSEFGIVAAAKHNGDYGFRFSSYSTATAYDQYLISPELDAAGGVVVTFYYAASSSSGTESFKVGYSTTDTEIASFTFGSEISTNSTTWTESDEYAFPAGTKYVAIHYSSNYQYRLYVDDFTFAAPPSCPKPANLTISEITATSAKATWTAGGSESAWDISIDNGATRTSLSSTTRTLSNLTPNTEYTVILRAKCSDNEYSAEVSTSFRTACAAISTFPYTENFDGITIASAYTPSEQILPSCWGALNTSTYSTYTVYPTVYYYSYTNYSRSTPNSLRFYSSYSSWTDYDPQDQYAILPPMSGVNGLRIRLWARAYSTSNDATFTVGVMTDPADASTFVAIATKTPASTTYEEYVIPFNKYSGNGEYIAIKMAAADASHTSRYVHIDDVTVEALPSCLEPADLAASAATAEGVTLSWSRINGASYEYVVLPDTVEFDAEQVSADAIHSATDTFAVVSGLNANSGYQAYVRATCGAAGVSEWSAGISFRTKCNAIAVIPFVESFENSESSELPTTCWTRVKASGSYPYVTSSTYSAYQGSKYLYFYGGISTSEQIIAMPEISADLSNARIRFWYKNGTTGTSYPSIILGKMSNVDDEDSFVAIETLEQKSTYTAYEKELTTVGSDYRYLAFKFAGGTSATSAYIDSIIIDAIPSCYPVVSLGISEEDGAITANSVLIEWAGHEGQSSQYSITIKEGDSILSYNGELYENKIVSGNSLRVRGLQSTHSYTLSISIAAVCSENDRSEVFTKNISFNTSCDAVSELPWNEGFENFSTGSSSASAPMCWDLAEANDGNYPYIYVNTSSGYVHSGSKSLYFQSSSSRAGFVILPEFADGLLNGSEIFFWYKHESATSSGVPTLGYMTNVADTSSFVAIESFERSTTWAEAHVALPAIPAGARLAIRYAKQSNNYYMGIDDIVIRKIPSCIEPTSVSVIDSTITATSATIVWSDASAEAGNYLLTIEKDSVIFNGYENVAVNGDTTFVIEGLNHSSIYNLSVSITKVCDGASSYAMEGQVSFATECAVVTELPWIENFNELTSGIPACWDNAEGTTTTASYRWNYYATGYEGAGVRFNSFTNSNGNTNVLATSFIALPATPAELNFMCKNPTGGAFSVSIAANGGQRQTLLSDLTGISEWTEMNVDLSAYAGDTIQLFFNATSNYGSGDAYLYLDNVEIQLVPSCRKPSAVSLASLSDTAAAFTWTSESAVSYSVEVFNGKTRLDSLVIAASALPYVIDTLQPNTDYAFTFNVYSICGEDGNSRAVASAVAFHTPCSLLPATATPFSYTENFESSATGSGKLPDCWSYAKSYGTSTIYPYVYNASSSSTYPHAGSKCLYFYGGSSTSEEVVALPGIEAPLSSLRIFFWYKATSSTYVGASYASLSVGVMSNPADASTFVPIKTLEKVSTYTQAEVMLTAAPADCHYIAFRYGDGTSFGYTVVDDIEIMPLPNCPKPAEINVDNVTPDAANVSWTPSGDETLWGVQLYQDTTLVQYSQVSESSIAFSGLSLKTSYVVKVSALCSASDSSEIVSTSFRTLGEITALPYSSDFEDDADNAKWSHVISSSYSPSVWVMGTATNNGGSKAMYVSSGFGSYQYNTSSSCASIIYRTFHFDAGDYIMSFDWKGVGEGSYDGMSVLFVPATANVDDAVFALSGSFGEGTATVDGVMISRNTPTLTTAAAKGWLPLTRGTATYSWFNQASDWQSNQTFEHSFDAPGDYHLVFFWTNDQSGGTNPPAAIDNLSIAKKLCGDITSIHDAQPTTTGATLSWAAVDDAISYDYVVLPRGEEFSDESMASVSDTIVQISGLAHSSFYDFYLRAVCSEGAGQWTSAEFHTECEMLMSTEVYNENDEMIFGFEEYAANKNLKGDILCWETVGGVWKTTSTAHSGSVGAYVAALGATDTFSLLITPAFELIEEQELVAYVKEGASHSDADSVVFYINDAPALEGATRIGAVAAIADWREFRGKLPEGWFTEDEIAEVEQAYILIQAYAEKAIYVDDIMLHYAPNCATVKNVEVAVEATSLTVTWEAGGNETSWAVSYAVNGAEKSWEGLVNNNPILVINDLPANTADTLTVEIVSLCEGDAMSEAVQSVFAYKTLCGSIAEFPWTENFDALTAGIPDCWDNSEGTTTYATYKWNYYATGHNGACVRFNSYSNSSNNTNILATPMIQLPANPVQLGFYCMNPTGGNYSVSISVAGGEPQVVLNNLKNISAWTEKEVDLTAYAGQTIQIFFNATSNYGSGDAYLYLDDVTITPITSCKPAKNAGVKDITMNSATLYWSPAATAGDYRVTVKDGEEILVDNQLAQDTFLVISNLTPSTAYTLEASITTDCGNGEVSYPYVSEIAFTTKCEAIDVTKQQPWAEDFELIASGEIDELCWTNEHISGGGSSLFKVYTSANGTNSTHQLQLPDMTGGTITRLTLPAMNIAQANAFAFSFDIYRSNSTFNDNYIYEGIRVLAKYEGSETEVELAFVPRQYTISNSVIPAEDAVGWYNYELTLPNAGVCEIILQGESQYCTSTYMDNLEVFQLPTCFKPSDVALVEYTTNSASFTWEGNADNYSVKIYNGTNLIADTLIAASELPFEIDTLQANTSYPFRFVVKGICSEDDESAENSSVVSVHTLCEALVIDDENWWAEDFNSLTQQYTIPDCWSNEEGTTTSSSYKWGAVGTGAVGSAYLRFNSYNNADGNTNVLATPTLILPETPAQLVFLCKNPAGGDFNVAIAGEDGVRDTVLSNLTGIADWTEQKIMLADYAGQTIRIFFNATSNYGSGAAYIDLDSVAINAAPNCMPVKNIEKFSLTANEVVFTWDQNGSEAQWDVVVTDNLNAQAQPLFNATVDSRSISIAIEPNTKYSMHVSVAAHCEGEGNISEAVAEDFIFRSPLSEDMVLEVENNTIDSIDLSDPDEQAKWTLLGADETNHFIFASFNENAGLYISNDGASWQYTTLDASSAAIAYRAFSVPEDNTPVEISFKWQANGQSTVDYGRAFIAGADVEMEIANHQAKFNGTQMTASNAISGVYSLSNGVSPTLSGATAEQSLTDDDYTLDAGQYYIVFAWRNNDDAGAQNPLGIYDLKIWNKKGYIPTAVGNITGEGVEVQKILQDGQVYILRDGVIYSILGTIVR